MANRTDWFQDAFSICAHNQVKTYCIQCTMAAREEVKLRDLAAKTRGLETDNTRLRHLLRINGIQERT
jgi:hypothetical protein